MDYNRVEFTPPDIWSLEPFFTLQVVQNVRDKQLKLWRELILGYCEYHDITEIFPRSFYYFKNHSIKAQLSRDDIDTIVKYLIALGDAKWHDSRVLTIFTSANKRMLTSASSTTTQQSDFSDYDAVRVQSADTLYSPRGHSSMSQFNQTSTTVTTHSNLRQISNQNHLAATQIQALFRAHVVRLRVWKYGGVLMVSRVRKIQRVFRGFLGRQKAAAAYKRKVLRSAHTIQGLYYTWHSKRQKLIAHLKFLNRAIIRFQSQFRRRKATQLVRIIRFIHHTKMATICQSVIRMFNAKRLRKRIYIRLQTIRQHLLEYCKLVRNEKRDGNFSSVRTKLIPIASEPRNTINTQSHGVKSNNHTNNNSYTSLTSANSHMLSLHQNNSQITTTNNTVNKPNTVTDLSNLDLFLCNVVAVGRYETALDIATNISYAAQVSVPLTAGEAKNGLHSLHTADTSSSLVYSNLTSRNTSRNVTRQNTSEEVHAYVLGEGEGEEGDVLGYGMGLGNSNNPHNNLTINNTNSASSTPPSSSYNTSSYSVYMSLMALWTRTGKIKAVRVDFLEEAVAIQLQSFLLTRYRNIEKSRKEVEDEVNQGSGGSVTSMLSNITHSQNASMIDNFTSRMYKNNTTYNNNINSTTLQLTALWLLHQGTIKYLIKNRAYNIITAPPVVSTANTKFNKNRRESSFHKINTLLRKNSIYSTNTEHAHTDSKPKISNITTLYNDELNHAIETYFQAALHTKHGTNISLFDAMLLMADCVAYHGNIKQQLFANPKVEQSDDIFVSRVRSGSEDSNNTESTNNTQSTLNSENRTKPQRKLSLHTMKPHGTHTAPHTIIRHKMTDRKQEHLAAHIINNATKTTIDRINVLFAIVQQNTADELKLHKITPIEQIRAVYLKESEMRTRYRIRSLLRRAQALLSPNSLDMREIVLKQEVYDNLWSKEECYVLVEKSDVLYPFRAVIPVVEAPVKPSTPKVNTPKSLRNKNTPQPAPPVAVKPPLTAEQLDQINQTTSSKQLAANEVQVLQCGRMVLVTGYVSCERLVDAYYGVESPSNSIHSSTYSMTYDSFLKQQQTPQTPTVNAPPVASPSILKQQKSVKNVEEASTANGTEDTLQPLPSLTAPNSTHSNSNSNSNTPKEPVKIKSLGDFMRRTSVAETTGIMRRRSVEFSTAQFQPENLLPFEPEPVAPPPVQQAVSTDSLTQCTSLPIQIRPLVLFISEIEYIAKLHSLYTEHKNLSTTQHNDDKLDLIGDASYSHVNTIDYQKVGEFLMSHVTVVSCHNRYNESEIISEIAKIHTTRQLSGESVRLLNTGLRFSLPVVEYKRRTHNEGRQVEYSTRILQKVYRGFRGRARFRRLFMKKQDIRRQQENTLRLQNKIKHVRHLRGNNARLIQCVFRGFRWRKELKRLNLQALIIQCAFRVFRAVNKVNAERVRRDGGPQVFEMIKGGRGLCIENLRFTLQIFRCGHNYRLQGTNLIEGVVYDGYVHQQDVWRLISERNSTIQGSSLASKQARIQMWQYERVIELIIVNLGFNTMIASVTSKLGGGKVDTRLTLVLNTKSKANVVSIQTVKGVPPGSMYRSYKSLLQKYPTLATGTVITKVKKGAKKG